MRTDWDLVWQEVLLPSEKIFWTSAPYSGIAIEPGHFMLVFFSLPWLAIGFLFSDFSTFSWTSLLNPHDLVGPAILIYVFAWTAYRRSRSRYCLSNRRAVIVQDYPVFGKFIRSVPITAQSEIELQPGRFTTIFLTKDTSFRRPGKKLGFLWIRDGMEVYKMMQRIQAKAQA